MVLLLGGGEDACPLAHRRLILAGANGECSEEQADGGEWRHGSEGGGEMNAHFGRAVDQMWSAQYHRARASDAQDAARRTFAFESCCEEERGSPHEQKTRADGIDGKRGQRGEAEQCENAPSDSWQNQAG